MAEQQLKKIQKVIEASFDKLERMNFDVENYLNHLTDKYCHNIDEKENENNKISLLVDVNNNNMCHKGHKMDEDQDGKCNKCNDKQKYLCWSCYYYDKKYDKDNWDKSFKKYIWCTDCSVNNVKNIKRKITKRKKKQQEIIDFYTKNPEISLDLLCELPSKLSLEYLLNEIVVDRNVNDYCLYLFDIDNFKKLNKCLGHNGADVKLKQIGKILREYTCKDENYWRDKGSWIDRVWTFRQGGDEFCIVTKGKAGEIKTQKYFIEEIKEKINCIGINISIGVLCYGVFIQDSSKWLDLCDSVLYSAKGVKGKNSLKIHDGAANGGHGKIIDSFENIKWN
eukprot:336150_1